MYIIYTRSMYNYIPWISLLISKIAEIRENFIGNNKLLAINFIINQKYYFLRKDEQWCPYDSPPWAAANQFLVSRPTLIAVAQSTEAFGIVRGTERERGERGPRERERGPFVSGGEGTATSKFGNCFLDWLGRSGSLISVCFSATCLKLLKFYYYY